MDNFDLFFEQPDKRKKVRISFRTTKNEFKDLQIKANEQNQTVSDYIRQKIIS